MFPRAQAGTLFGRVGCGRRIEPEVSNLQIIYAVLRLGWIVQEGVLEVISNK